jgi:zinc protease
MPHFLYRPARAFAAMLVLVSGLSAAQAAEGDDPQISTFELDNGLEVVVIPDRRAPVVTHMIWYRAGSADEEPGKSGIAHFLEHLMFKGTQNHEAGEFSAAISQVGGRENAFTSFDYTAYFQQIAPDQLETMMSFEADRMRNLVLTDAEIETERQVIMEERVQVVENRPEAILGEEVSATIYRNHRYGIPIIGWMHEIETLDRESLQAFYDRFYTPSNAILVVAGDVDEATVRDLAERTYGRVEDTGPASERVRATEAPPQADRVVELRDERVTVPSYSQRWLVPSSRTAEPGDSEALDLLSEVLGGGIRSRLYQRLVVEDGIANSVGAFYRGTSYDETTFGVFGSPRGEATLEDVETAVAAELVRLIEEGVGEDELERAKNRYMRSMIYARDNQSTMARMYGAVLASGGAVDDIAQWSERIRAVSAEQVVEAARRFIEGQPSVKSYLLPQDGEPS